MFRRKFILLAIVLLGLIAVSAASAAGNDTGDVLNVANDDLNMKSAEDISSADMNGKVISQEANQDEASLSDGGSDAGPVKKIAKSKIVNLNKNRKIKIGKYTVKLSKKQYKSLTKAVKKGKSKKMVINTKYTHKFKKTSYKNVKKYKTTKSCKTFYGSSYLPTMKKMKSKGWKKVSQYTYTKKNPRNSEGIGLSAYTYAITKWVKTYKKAFKKTKQYPVKAKITFKKSDQLPRIKVCSHGKTLKEKYVAIK